MKPLVAPPMAELAANRGSATIKRMWLPRFTLRRAFLIITLCAFVALIAGQAVAGKEWAIAVSIAIAGAAFFFGVYAVFFVILQALPIPARPAPTRASAGKAKVSTPPADETSRSEA